LKDLKTLNKTKLVDIIESIVTSHASLVRTQGDRWWVEDSEIGLEVKSILENYGLIGRETIND